MREKTRIGIDGPRPALGGLLVAAAVLLVGGCHGDATPGSEPDRVVVRAPTALVERLERPLEVEVYGTVETTRTADVSARIMAMVTRVEVQAGDRVRRGQSLLEIDPQIAEGQLSQARGALAQARAALALAERNHRRFEALAATEAASELELDTARMHYEQAKGAVEQADGAVRAAVAMAADTRVTAPFDGRVVRRSVEVGDLAAPGRPLLTVESAHGRRLALRVPESVAARGDLAIGRTVRVAIDTHPDLGAFEAPVVEMAPGVDPASHSFSVKVALPIDDLPSGISGRAWIVTGRRQLVAVPRAAVLERGGLTLVVLAVSEGRLSTRLVTVGAELAPGDREEWVEVLSGLAGGETVLVGLAAPPPAGARLEAAS